jgi:hypothetical protein
MNSNNTGLHHSGLIIVDIAGIPGPCTLLASYAARFINDSFANSRKLMEYITENHYPIIYLDDPPKYAAPFQSGSFRGGHNCG